MTGTFDFVQTIHSLDAARWGAPWGIAVTPAATAGETPDEALASGLRVLVVPVHTVRSGHYDAGAQETLEVGGMLVLTFPSEAAARSAVPYILDLARPGRGDA